MDKFLRSMGFSSLQRLAVLKAGQVQVIRRQDDHLHIITRDMRGTSELVLLLNGPSVRGEGDGGKSVSRRAFADGNDLVITETVANEREPLSVCRRSLRDDGKLCVDIKKKRRTARSRPCESCTLLSRTTTAMIPIESIRSVD